METLLVILTLIQRAGSKRLLLSLISRFMLVLGLMVIAAIMVSATLIIGLIYIHMNLLLAGMTASGALLLIILMMICINAVLITVIMCWLKHFRRKSQMIYGVSPIAIQAIQMCNAFAAGFMKE